MYPSLRHVLMLAASALALTGCAPSMRVNAYPDRAIDFARYRTFSWDAAERQATGDPRLDNNPFFHGRIRAEVEQQLAARGLERVAPGSADLVIHVHASINQRVEPEVMDRRAGYSSYPPEDVPRPFVYDAGTLMLDFVDTRTNTVVWRGWAEGSMDAVIDNQDWLEQRIADAVTRILRQLPPAG